MNWNVKFRKQQCTLKSVDSVRAVCPTREFRAKAKRGDYKDAFGEIEAAQETPIPSKDRRIFERAGWRFVAPNEQVAQAARLRKHMPNASAAREVFVNKAGVALMATERATVQLLEDMTAEQVDQTLKKFNLEKIDEFKFAKNMLEVRLPSGRPLPEVIEELDNSGSFVFVEPDLLQTVKVREGKIPEDVNLRKQWQHRNDGSGGGIAGEDMKSIEAWEITKGAGVRIAVIDTGMQINHKDLVEAVVGGGIFTTPEAGGYSFVRLTPGMNNFPLSSHGTFCMGLAAARANPNGDPAAGGCGIAPEADLFPIACADNQVTSQAILARAVHFAVQPSAYDPEADPEDGGAHIISCSLDTNEPLSTVLETSIKFANQQGRKGLGVPIFWSVNNLDQSIQLDPVCCMDEVIAVGRYNKRGLRAAGAIGEQLAFLAPGVGVYSTRSGNQYGTNDGTSFATALAAGVGALVVSQHPDWTVGQVRQKLQESCDPVNGSNGFHILWGHGRLNAHRAVS